MPQNTSLFGINLAGINAVAETNAAVNYALPIDMLPAYSTNLYQPLPSYAIPAQPAAPKPPAEPVSAPTYDKAVANFGTMRHIEPVRDHFINARLSLENLRRFATDSSGTGKSLLERVETYLKKHLGDDYEKLLGELGVSIGTSSGTTSGDKLSTRFFSKALPKLGDAATINSDKIVTSPADKPWAIEPIAYVHNTHSALFATGTVMTDDIRTMEALRHALVKLRRLQQLNLDKKQAQLAETEANIQTGLRTLRGLEAERSEKLDDYAVAQRLLAEHWQEIEQAYTERKRIIEGHLGLFYVRVRETPLSRGLPDPLALRSASADDLVPGCAIQSSPLSEELTPFMSLLLDIPVADWSRLNGLSGHLPGRLQLEQLVLQRRQRIQIKQQTPNLPFSVNPTLAALLNEHHTMRLAIAARPFVVTNLVDMQQQGQRILALEDLLASPIPALREPATQLHQQLTSAAACLLSRLRRIRPSLRLAWADLADDNRLDVSHPERWPNLDKAEADDFNNLRTLVELVAWWFRQLDAEASGDSRTAMRNFIRACLLLAASDDPQQLLQGQLKSLPSRLRAGELLRLDLNREPAPGNLLHILDEQQHVVATLRVEDHDSKGTLASIATVINPGATLNLAMRVTGLRS